MIDMVLNQYRVNEFFRTDVKFVEDLSDEVKVYKMDNGEIAVVIDLVKEVITKETMDFFQTICESNYFKHGEKPVNMFIITVNCLLLVQEYPMPSQATFTIKMCAKNFEDVI